jgi:predicted ester cyclase
MRFEVADEIPERDHVGEFLGKPPSGKEFATKQIHVWRIEDWKAIEYWSVRDDLGQALQLGLI